MAHDPGEPNSTNTDIYEKAIGTARLWVAQFSGPLRAFRLPTGLLDLFGLTQTPALPPAGWYRFSVLNNVIRLLDSSGADILGGGGAAAFLGLTDTPASYVGQGLLGVRVNAGETALEFAATVGSEDITHHAYPQWIRRDFANHVEGGSQFFDRESLLHYPGWTLGEQDTTSQGGNTNAMHTAGEELDGRATSRRTSFYKVLALTTEEGWNPLYDLRIAVPNSFTAWGADGIILRHKIAQAGGQATDTGVIRIDVYDPSAASDTSAANASRTRTGAEAADTVYQDLQITGATLNALSPGFSAGEMLHLRIDLSGAFVAGAGYPTFHLGRLSAYFE